MILVVNAFGMAFGSPHGSLERLVIGKMEPIFSPLRNNPALLRRR
jgi:hypothetical protein